MITATATRTIPPTETPQRTSRGGARHVLSLFMVCVVMLMAASGTGWAVVTSQTVQTLTVSGSVSVLRDGYHEVNRHYGVNGVRIDAAGNFYLAYGNGTNLKFLKYDKASAQWSDTLVGVRSKAVQYPSLAATSNGNIYLHAAEFDRNATYGSIWDSSLYYLRSGTSNWSKLQDIYANRGSEQYGPADIAKYIFADPADNIHVGLAHDGWWSYGYKQSEMIFNTTTNTLGSQVTISDRASGGPDNARNAPFGSWESAAVFLDNNQKLVMPLIDFDTSTLFVAESAQPYGSWNQTDKTSSGGMGPFNAFQDAQGHSHLLLQESGTSHLYYITTVRLIVE